MQVLDHDDEGKTLCCRKHKAQSGNVSGHVWCRGVAITRGSQADSRGCGGAGGGERVGATIRECRSRPWLPPGASCESRGHTTREAPFRFNQKKTPLKFILKLEPRQANVEVAVLQHVPFPPKVYTLMLCFPWCCENPTDKPHKLSLIEPSSAMHGTAMTMPEPS